MARYVLLEFDDNAEADNFVNMLNGGDFDGHPAEVMPGGTVRVRGVYFKPTLFCECPNPGDRSARGEKWGLWIHRDCGKPKRGNVQHPRNLTFTEAEWQARTPRAKTDLYIGVREG
jgi:hypothetical protein